MTRWIGTALIAIAAVSATLASATESQAWGRRGGCGSNGGGGSWGNRGSNGGGGSFGGLFSRGRNGSHGGWGSNGGRHGNGWGSNGGHYRSDGCGSHGGAYRGDVVIEGSADSGQGEVRYFGEREESTAPMAAPAPIMEDGTQGDSGPSSQDSNPGQDVNAPNVPDQPDAVQQNINQPASGNQSNPIPTSPPQGAGTTGDVGT